MLDSVFTKILDAFRFNLKELVTILLLVVILYYTFATNQTIATMEERYQSETYASAEAVIVTLQKNDIDTPEGILAFLSEKPAGKTDLRKGIMNDQSYEKLLETYGDLAKKAKIAFNY